MNECKWKRIDGRTVEAHDIRWHLGDMKGWKYCPYCGKKIRREDEVS